MTRLRAIALCTVVLLVSGCRQKSAPTPSALGSPTASSAAGSHAGVGVQAGRCAMCGMDISQHPDWVGSIELPDGSVRHGCSVRCTLALHRHASKFLGVEPAQIRHVRVPDYLHPGTQLEASAALYVVDSDVKGPMGVELVPAASEADARTIVQRHGGRVLRGPEVTVDVLRNLKEHGKSVP